ncbi:MAG: hypothetical protein JO110_12790, partial [Acetobacteraceae bacterium]|nr:hypothetical protein [Acetobacteraceae bacterium]
MSDRRLFRSVNLRDDLAAPERLAHYQPTRRSAPVIGAVLRSGATMVIAAYGSGKSFAAGVGALSVLNKDEQTLRSLAERLRSVDQTVSSAVAGRLQQHRSGRVVILSGHVRDLPATLAEALGTEQKRTVDAVLEAVTASVEADHIAIIWDEFGRHLEGVVAEGRARELDAVQRLAEWAVRAKGRSASLTLLLHQNLLAYATALNQTTRNEWRKVEGRFAQIRFVEDSQELYELAATLIADRCAATIWMVRADNQDE